MIKLCVVCKKRLDKLMYQSKCRPCFKIEREEEILGLKAEIKGLKRKIETIREVIDAEYIDWRQKDSVEPENSLDVQPMAIIAAGLRAIYDLKEMPK